MEAEYGHLGDERIVEVLTGGAGTGPSRPLPSENRILLEEAAHLERCDACSCRVAEVRKTLLMLHLAGSQPSDESVERIWSSARQQVEPDRDRPLSVPGLNLPGKVAGAIRELVASLIPQPAIPTIGVRGSQLDSQAVQIYETEEFIVSLSVLPSDQPNLVRLLGSVAPKSSEGSLDGGTAAIFGGGTVIRTPVNDAGEFEADRLEPGDLHIEIDLGGVRIQLSPVSALHPMRGR